MVCRWFDYILFGCMVCRWFDYILFESPAREGGQALWGILVENWDMGVTDYRHYPTIAGRR
jgi:hypothetical protein